jgi:hypothetical protein
VLDVLEPGPSLAGLADAAARGGGLAGLDDDELIGVLRAWRRLESWSTAGMLAAVAELARRRPAERAAPARPGAFPGELSEFIGDEVAAALVLTGQAASTYLDLALDLATRLPGTARALREGVIDYLKARIIAGAVKVLSDADAGAVEARILAGAGRQTTGQLRAALARAVLAVDPEAAARRRELAQKDARVRRWQEDAGTAALAGYGLPPAEVLEADQKVTARALDLRAAGLAGSLEELRARAYLDALLGRDSMPIRDPAPGSNAAPGDDVSGGDAQLGGRDEPAQPGEFPPPGGSPPAGEDGIDGGSCRADGDGTGDEAASGSGSGQAGRAAEAAGSAGMAEQSDARDQGRPGDDGERRRSGENAPHQPAPAARQGEPAGLGGRAGGPGRLAARVNLTVPLMTLLGLADDPGEVGGFGPLDPRLAPEISRAAGAHPVTRWCLTVTDDQGQAIGHGCVAGRRPAEVLAAGADLGSPGGRAGPSNSAGPDGRAGSDGSTGLRSPRAGGNASPGGLARGFTVRITALARGSCDHRSEEPGYEPSRRLRHLIRARTATCSAPGCRQPAAQCDLDHTLPYDQGGRTCECELAPLCRHHHRNKQAEGWRLEQPSPGVMCWTTPAGRRYITTPTTYPA